MRATHVLMRPMGGGVMERHAIKMKLFACVLFGVLVLSGCAPLTQYRTDYRLCNNPEPAFSPGCATSALQQFPAADGASYFLGFVEFDDQGQLWDRRQMWAVIDELNAEAADKDLLMVVFVHGWKHSAVPGDNNIETFRKVLARLSEDEMQISRKTGLPARRVAGVYLGWRGESVTIPYVDNLTFWDRKNTAQTVGHGGVTEVLNRIELVKRDKDSTQSSNGGTRLAIIGHSFGGAAVYTSLSQILQGRFVRTKGPAGKQTDVEGFGKLVVLINPAFEASLFAPLSDMSAERTYLDSQLPVMAILTSEADYATRYAFPAGRFFSTVLEKDRTITRRNKVTQQDEHIDEGEANTQAVGHFGPYRTHRLYPVDADVTREQVAPMSSSESVRSIAQASAAWENDKPGSKIAIAGLTLERSDSSAGRNPYLVVRVDKALIRDHNDIDDPRVIEFIKQIILISAQSPERKERLQKSLEPARR